MAVTINAKGTSISSFTIGKNGLQLSQTGEITVPLENDLIINLDGNRSLLLSSGISGPTSIITSSGQDLHISPDGNLQLIENIWPQTDGTENQVLTTDGSGNLSWTTPTGGGGSNSAQYEPIFMLMGA